MDFGEKLRKLRKESGLTQKQLADRLGLAKSIVSYYENGSRYPSYDVLVKLARIFHVSTDYFLGLEKGRSLGLEGLTEEDVELLQRLAENLRNKNRG